MTPGKNRLDQIERGLDGVTAGPYEAKTLMVKAGREIICHFGISNSFSPPRPDECVKNAAHYARCSPDAIREIAAYVRDLEERLAKAADALEPFAKEADIYDPPNGDDAHAAWSGDFPIGSLRRARTALSQIRSEK